MRVADQDSLSFGTPPGPGGRSPGGSLWLWASGVGPSPCDGTMIL